MSQTGDKAGEVGCDAGSVAYVSRAWAGVEFAVLGEGVGGEVVCVCSNERGEDD